MVTIKAIYKNIILFAVSIAISLLILESAFRIFMPQLTYSAAKQSSPRVYQSSEYLPWTLKPNSKDRQIGVYGDFNVSIEINSYGLRDYERHVSNNKTRILVIGDSMAYGFGVEMNETYAKFLEKMLNKNGDKFQVFNAGWADGYSVDSYYLYLKNYAMEKFKPSIIILEFSAYNDITDIGLNRWEKDDKGFPLKVASPYYSVDEENRLRTARRVLPLLKNRAVKEVYDFFLAHSHLFVFVKNKISSIIETLPSNRVFDKEYSPKIQEEWEINEKLMLTIRDMAVKKNAKLIILPLPAKFQIFDNEWEKYAASIGKDKLARTKPEDIMKEFGAKNNITVVSLYDVFYEKSKKENLFLKFDGHFNPEGHKAAAEEIYKYIK